MPAVSQHHAGTAQELQLHTIVPTRKLSAPGLREYSTVCACTNVWLDVSACMPLNVLHVRNTINI